MVTEYSDILTIFLLKGLRPDRYRERVEVRGGLAHLDLRQLPDELLQRIAQGENIMTVLASALPQRDDGSVDTSRLLARLGSGTPPAGAERVEHEDVTGEEREPIEPSQPSPSTNPGSPPRPAGTPAP